MLNITNEDNMLLMARYPDNYFDLAIVDPPYGIGLVKTKAGNWGIRKENKGSIVKDWDFYKPSVEYFNELFRVSKNQIVWGANHFIENIPINSSCWLVWDKQNGESYFADSELAWTSFTTAVRNFKTPTIKKNRIHECQKPVALYKWILDKYAKQGDKILDTHLGSGSIAIACHDYGFDLVACELDKEYFDKAMQRINNHVSQQKLF
jgi:site-specific DNA-methyltransferase (adenine-specific)